MTALLQEYETPIADCLEQCATAVRAIDGAGWEFTPARRSPPAGHCRLKKGWLRLCSPLSVPSSSRPTPEILDRMLAQNVELAAAQSSRWLTIRPCLVFPRKSCLDEEQSDLGVKISRACDGFGQALQEFAGGRHWRESHAEDAPATCDKEEVDELALDLAALCKETGWPLASVPATRWRSSWMFQAVSARPWCNPGGGKGFISELTWRVPRPAASPAGMH